MRYRRMLDDAGHLLTGQAGNIITGLASTVLLAKLLSVEDMGRYSLFFVVVSLAISLGFSWSDTSVVRHGREEYMKRGRINRSFWARSYIFLPVAAAFVLLFILLGERIAGFIGVSTSFLPFLISIFVLNGSLNFLEKIFRSIGLFRRSAYVLLMQKALFLVSLILMAAGTIPATLMTVVFMFMASLLISFLVNLRGLDRKVFMPHEFDKQQFRKIWDYSWPHLIGFSGLYLVNNIDLLVIRQFLDLESVGIYNVAYRGFAILTGLIMVMHTVFLPYIVECRAKGRRDEVDGYIDRAPLMASGWLALVVIGIFGSGMVVRLLFSEKYLQAVPSLNILLVSTAFYFISIYMLPVINAFDLVIFSQAFNLLKSGINVIGDILLVPKVGIIGAAYSTMIAYALSSVLSVALVMTMRRRFLHADRA